MSERTARAKTPVTPINFRMPTPLRARLRRFAEERSLGESDALRLVLSEHLNEIDDERQLLAAERWQYKQALRTWERMRRGEEKFVEWSDIEKTFDRAMARLERRRDRAK